MAKDTLRVRFVGSYRELRTAQAADIAGIRCLLVHAKDDAARQWYESWEFDPSPTDPYHLFLMLKDLKGMLS